MSVLIAVALGGAATSEAGQGHVDWSRHVLVVETTAAVSAGTRLDRSAVELEARRTLTEALPEAAAMVRLEGDVRVGDLLEGEHGRALEEGLVRWRVTEARYGLAGTVDLVGELDLATWLRPLAVATARGSDDAARQERDETGVLIDARAVAPDPSYAPRVLGPDGAVVFELATLSPLAAAKGAPAVWVTDPADELVFDVAGRQPLVLVAAGADGADLTLSADDAARLRALGAQTDLLARGRVVVVTP